MLLALLVWCFLGVPLLPLLEVAAPVLANALDQVLDIGVFCFQLRQAVFGFDRKERGKPLRLRRLQPLFELFNVVLQERDARCEHVSGFLRRQRWQQRQPGLKLRKLFDRGAQNGAHPVPQFRYSRGGEVVDRFLGAVPLAGGVPCHDQARLHQQGDYRVQRPVAELDAVLFVALAEGGGHLIRVHGALVEQDQDGESQRVGTFPFRLRHRFHPSTNIRLRVYVKEERLSRRLGSGSGSFSFQFNPDQVQGCTRPSGETSAGCRHVGIACPAHEPNHCVAQRRHDLRDVATPYLGGSCWIPGSWMCRCRSTRILLPSPLGSPSFSMALKMSPAARTTLEHKTPESNKSD